MISPSTFHSFALLSLLFLPSFLLGQQVATLGDGTQIIIYADHSWSRLGEPQPTLELPSCTPTILSSKLLEDKLQLLILDNGEERILEEPVVILNETTEEQVAYVDGPDKRVRKSYPLQIQTTRFQIGTEVFSHVVNLTPTSQTLYQEINRNDWDKFYVEEGLFCLSSDIVYARNSPHTGSGTSYTAEPVRENLSLAEAKVLAANMFTKIMEIRLVD